MSSKRFNMRFKNSKIPTKNTPNTTNLIALLNILVCFASFSIENRITLSTILTVRIGNSSSMVETSKSYTPYSSVERILVYKGTKKKTRILEEKLLIAKIPVFLNNLAYLEFKTHFPLIFCFDNL